MNEFRKSKVELRKEDQVHSCAEFYYQIGEVVVKNKLQGKEMVNVNWERSRRKC